MYPRKFIIFQLLFLLVFQFCLVILMFEIDWADRFY